MANQRALVKQEGNLMIWALFVGELAKLRVQYRQDRTARRYVQGLIVVGAGLVAASILRDLTRHFDIHIPFESAFSLTRDRSLPEYFMYFCSLTCAACCFASFRAGGEKAFLFMTLLFGFIFLDDALSYHEEFGELIVRQIGGLGMMFNSQETGELIAWSVAGVLLVPPLIWCILRMRSGEIGIYLVFAALFGALVFFAVGMDLVHSLTKIALGGHERMAKAILRAVGWIEDGGELIVVSLAASTGVLFQRGAHDQTTGRAPAGASVV